MSCACARSAVYSRFALLPMFALFFGAYVMGVGSLLSSGKRERRLCLEGRLGVSTALCPPG